jgi:hypothetical protein
MSAGFDPARGSVSANAPRRPARRPRQVPGAQAVVPSDEHRIGRKEMRGDDGGRRCARRGDRFHAGGECRCGNTRSPPLRRQIHAENAELGERGDLTEGKLGLPVGFLGQRRDEFARDAPHGLNGGQIGVAQIGIAQRDSPWIIAAAVS